MITICKRFVRQEQTKSTEVRLNTWNKTKLQPLGDAMLEVTNPSTGKVSEHLFIDVPNGLLVTCLLGLITIQMGLVTVSNDMFIVKVETQQMGDFGEANL